MGRWGMGMTQSDEFCEAYDKFMDAYNDGKDISEITDAILSEYHTEFDDDDGIMHDVYFALAKAEWMCREQSETILKRVKDIIESGADITFYRELGASEKDLKIRQKNLEKFWDSLQTPREKPRQRRADPSNRIKELPPLKAGECYRYKHGEGYRVFVVLGFNKAQGWRDMMRCGIFQKTYSAADLKTTDFLHEPLHSIACYLGEELLAPSSIKRIATFSAPERYSTSLNANQLKNGCKKDFNAEFTTSIVATLSQMFAATDFPEQQAVSPWSDILCGDLYAYRTNGGYRIFVLLHTWPMVIVPAIYCYAWRKTFAEIPTTDELHREYVMPLGWFTEQFFPHKSKLTYIGNDASCNALKYIHPVKLFEKWKPATLSIAKEAHLTEDYPLNLCEKLCDVIQRSLEITECNTEPNTKKGENEMLGFKKKDPNINKVLKKLVRNEISVKARNAANDSDIYKSKFGGKPAVPADFEWPRYEAENYDGETANRPLSFLCQIDLEEIRTYDKEKLLPQKGLLLFFYEQESMRWGFDPEDKGCSRVYYFEDVSRLTEADFPNDMKDEYRVKEYSLSFTAKNSYPSFDELACHSDEDCDGEDYDEALESKGYDLAYERHKILGYADPVQSEMLTECERTTRGLYCGNADHYRSTSEDTEKDINEKATDWILLFQMASIQEDDYELMFGDLGNLYFYIRKQDLKNRNFDQVWLVLQCC